MRVSLATAALTCALFFPRDSSPAGVPLVDGGGNVLPWDTFTPGRAGVADIQGLVTHEWGHALGCDHVPLRTSTMVPKTDAGVISLRSIAPDDRALVGSIYPNAAFQATTGSIAGVVHL